MKMLLISWYKDYYGFPPETYNLKYDAPGEPEVAKEVYEVFSAAALKPKMDDTRGMNLKSNIDKI